MSRFSPIIRKIILDLAYCDLGWKYRDRLGKYIHVGNDKGKIPNYAKSSVKRTRTKRFKINQSYINAALDGYRRSVHFSSRANKSEVNSEEVIKEVTRRLSRCIKRANVVVQIHLSDMDSVLQDGKLKNQLECGKSSGAFEPKHRKRFEESLFDIPLGSPVSQYPIYGYLEDKDQLKDTSPKNTSVYGQVSLVLDKSVKNRGTFCVGDSLDGIYNHLNRNPRNSVVYAVSPLNDPSAASISPNGLKRLMDAQLHNGDSFLQFLDPKSDMDHPNIKRLITPASAPYVEVQIHGGIDISDIKEIVIRKHPDERDNKIVNDKIERIKQRLPNVKITEVYTNEL